MADEEADVIRLKIPLESNFLTSTVRGQWAGTGDTKRICIHDNDSDTISVGVSDDSLQCLLAGTQTISGSKTFSDTVKITDGGLTISEVDSSAVINLSARTATKDVEIRFRANNEATAGDIWNLVASGTDQTMSFINDSNTRMELSAPGVLKVPAGITVGTGASDDGFIGHVDSLALTLSSSGAAAFSKSVSIAEALSVANGNVSIARTQAADCKVSIKGGAGKDGVLSIASDALAATNDEWTIKASHANQALQIANEDEDIFLSLAQANGNMTLAGDMELLGTSSNIIMDAIEFQYTSTDGGNGPINTLDLSLSSTYEADFRITNEATGRTKFRVNMDFGTTIGNSPDSRGATCYGRMFVTQGDATGEDPALLLHQEDLSEEMIELSVDAIGVGNTIEAVGAKTLTPTHFLKVKIIPGNLIRYIPMGTIA